MTEAASQTETLSWRLLDVSEYPRIRSHMRAALATEEVFTLPATATDEQAIEYWFGGKENEVWALEEGGEILGTFYQCKNQYQLGEHIANGGYLVNPEIRGRGIGRKLCEKSIERAIGKGYRGIQFNFVVSTNEPAVHLWKEHGFEIIGTIPRGYFRKHEEYVDAYIMFKDLTK